jgi:hypothetical protein
MRAASSKKTLGYESIPETIWEGMQEDDEDSLDQRKVEKKKKKLNPNNSLSPERQAYSERMK